MRSAAWIFDDHGTELRCGGCTLCCRLLPVPSLDKLAGQQSRHASTGKGCSIYS